jgi:hypothetical protein
VTFEGTTRRAGGLCEKAKPMRIGKSSERRTLAFVPVIASRWSNFIEVTPAIALGEVTLEHSSRGSLQLLVLLARWHL